MKIFISGATGGIGVAVAKRLAGEGHVLALTARDMQKLETVRTSLISGSKIRVSLHQADFTNSQSVEKVAAEIVAMPSHFDGVVLIYPRIDKPSEVFPPAEIWQRNWSTCFIQPLEMLRAASANLRPGGKIVVVSGIASGTVFPHLSLSNAIRSAWLAQAKTLSFALGDRGIRINTVSLGCIVTERIKTKLVSAPKTHDPMNVLVQEDKISALKHNGTPEQAAAAICGMLSPFADHLTGTNIVCDGGYSRHY